MATELEGAWDALHAATPRGWYARRPSLHDERHEWLLYAFDPAERPIVGVRKRDWTARTSLSKRAGDIRGSRGPPARW